MLLRGFYTLSDAKINVLTQFCKPKPVRHILKEKGYICYHSICMKRYLTLSIAILFIVLGLFLIFYVFQLLRPAQKGGLQVTANIKSTVFLNGKEIGETPFCKCEQNNTIKAGEYEIKLVPQDNSMTPFITKVEVKPDLLTAVERIFLPGSLASTSTITLEKAGSKDAQILVSSIPEGAMVLIDGIPSGATPYLQKKIPPSEHEIEIQKQGFSKKTLRVKTIEGYKVVVNVTLGTEGNTEEILKSAGPTQEPTPTPTSIEDDQEKVTISDTPTGFLRVRSGASLSSSEITQVKPGETYTLLEEQTGWYQIQVDENTTGWISSRYATKTSQ